MKGQNYSLNIESAVTLNLGVSCLQVVRSALWPSERSPVFFTAGEDARICAWSTVAGEEEESAAKRSLDAANVSQPVKKRKKQKGS